MKDKPEALLLGREVCEHISMEPVWIIQDGETYLINRLAQYRVKKTGIRFFPAVWFCKPKGSIPKPIMLPLLPHHTVKHSGCLVVWADLLRMSAELCEPDIKASFSQSGAPQIHAEVDAIPAMTPHQWAHWILAYISFNLPDLADATERRMELDRHLKAVGVDLSFADRPSAYHKARQAALQLTLKAEKFLAEVKK
jgi:hypothetical protein